MNKEAYDVGGTLYASNIERPQKSFYVEIVTKCYLNVTWHESQTRTFRVLSETAEGALKIAQYHYQALGESFKLVEPRKLLIG
jgi:hypothetical protein